MVVASHHGRVGISVTTRGGGHGGSLTTWWCQTVGDDKAAVAVAPGGTALLMEARGALQRSSARQWHRGVWTRAACGGDRWTVVVPMYHDSIVGCELLWRRQSEAAQF